MVSPSARDRHLTVHGRKPVLEALTHPGLRISRVFVAHGANGATIEPILQAAARGKVPIERVKAEFLGAVTRSGQHQGVAADVSAPQMSTLGEFCDRRSGGRNHATTAMVLDGLTNPANVGMILRAATAAGLDGIIVPRRGTAELGPIVVKASAGVAFSAPIVHAETAHEAVAVLAAERFEIVGLAGDRPDAEDLFETALPERVAYVVGNETSGIADETAEHVDRWFRIPLAGGVESLNVATAATLVCFEATRARRRNALD